MSAFLDTTVPLHATGADHPEREPSRLVMLETARNPRAVVTSSEVLQEILNLCLRRKELERGIATISNLVEILGADIEPVGALDVLSAAIGSFEPSLSARDRIHVTVMRRLGISTIISADGDFDRVPDIRRLDPLRVGAWRDEVFGAARP